MSSLRERLLRHKKSENGAVSTASESIERPDGALKEGGDDGASSEQAARDEWEPVGAHMERSDWGSFVLRRRTFPAGFRHGKYELSLLNGQAEPLNLLFGSGAGRTAASESLAEDEASSFHERLLFMDTETTGLGLGAGNVPFMIGIGFYEGGAFTVEQMVIRHPGEEIAMLAYLQEKLKAHPILISYNGKSFDWPIVKNRYIMNRMPLQAEPQGHIDFLYPSRSLWKYTLPSCRLGKVEEERLMVHREDDVPGSLAPTLYFQYLSEKDPTLLQGVFEHNELDVLSLAGLAVHFAGVLGGRFGWQEVMEFGYEEWFRMGLWLDKVGMADAAKDTMDALIEALSHAGWSEEEQQPDTASTWASALDDMSHFLLPLAQYYKKHGEYEQACQLWERYIALKGDRTTASLEPYIELSMHYEHREKRWEQALKYAELALDKLWQRGALKHSGRSGPFAGRQGFEGAAGSRNAKQPSHDTEEMELEKRIARLKRKATSHSVSGPKSKTRSEPLRTDTVSSRRRTNPEGEQLTLPLEHSV